MSQRYRYLIVGGGMAGDAAVRGIRQVDPEGAIGLIGSEPDPPYNRPPLSKGLWKPGRPMPLSRIWRGTENLGVSLHLGRQVTALDPAAKTVTDDQGESYSFDRLLLATGGDPLRLGPPHERILYYRTLADYQRLRALTGGTETASAGSAPAASAPAASATHFVVIGGGFIGSEMAAVLAALGKQVTMIFPEPGIGWRVLPEEVSLHLNEYFRERGVRVLNGQLVEDIHPDDDAHQVTLRTDRQEKLRADAVVAGLGIRPNVALAEAAGLVTGNGIHVDETLRTSHPDIYAAGDVINFYNPTLDRRMRVEHEENANLTGQLAGLAMAGQPQPYRQLPSVYSKIFDINYDAVGDLDPRLEVVTHWQEPFQQGTAYYLRDGRVRGVLLWNIPRGLDAARQLIAEPGPFLPADLKKLNLTSG